MQLFVRCLDARSRVCDVEPCCSVADLKRRIEEVESVPSCSQGLVYAGRQLQDERSLESYGIVGHSTVHLVLRLRGGKGGFGALLRGLGRDGSKTTNDDAMRDLQGRRLRHANAEKKMKDWEAKAKERELEKIALQHIKQQERQARRDEEKKVPVPAAHVVMQDELPCVCRGTSKAEQSPLSGWEVPTHAFKKVTHYLYWVTLAPRLTQRCCTLLHMPRGAFSLGSYATFKTVTPAVSAWY
ncbi:hypothetical protein VOLCADRAFT_83025 [Volvox carteri f. nagariensis]|uniref:Ubiquitin-like domain-containing protein n=1 Tax=Volvox carteri f. nagariensis TaxID=3068 RepID=D8U8Q9_VOLCA|nr:uncharacterized protein VOLCADRAFT_83025 [Volvox carteri f. nagariensis]EFJ43792.1 hypothetical protein VOLCADRAFT_83025 [Volvox carteri f. nagariensis]|eukprot:XP_002955038.1 hypothetical protein VOLCADRAFT_83025 [Volvox carteri f. nagariensis]